MSSTTPLVNTGVFTVAFVAKGESHYYEVFSVDGVKMLVQGLVRENLVITHNGIRVTLEQVLAS